MAEVKAFKGYVELLEIMENHGLIVLDRQLAISLLNRVNYYRFSAYFLTYKNGKEFYDGVTFEDVTSVYFFDCELRLLLLKYIAYVEILFRNAVSHRLGDVYGPLGYINPDNFSKKSYHHEFTDGLRNSLEKSNEIFVRHHKDKYDGKYPVWVAIQTISFGRLSKLYDNMLPQDQKNISRTYFKKPNHIISAWLKSAADLRNVCAHWGRLYNRPMPSLKLDKSAYPASIVARDRCFAYMIALFHLLPYDSLRKAMRDDFRELLRKYPKADTRYLGCTQNWSEYLYVKPTTPPQAAGCRP